MAKEDDDWAAFQASISEPGEAVETDDDSSEDEGAAGAGADDDQGADDKSKKAAKPGGDDDAGGSDDEDDAAGEDDDAGAGADAGDGKPSLYKPRLKQFLNKDGSINAEKIEKSYLENSKETVRLDTVYKDLDGRFNQLIAAIKAKPEVAKALFGEQGAKDLAAGAPAGQQAPADPLLAHVKAQMDNASKRDYNEFVEAHPEAVTDPEKARKIGRFLKIFGQEYREEHDGEFPTMKEGLEAAYRYHGWALKITKKEEVATAARDTAATRRTPAARKPATKQQKSQLEGFFAKKLGVKVR